jgi:hypothetical protein
MILFLTARSFGAFRVAGKLEFQANAHPNKLLASAIVRLQAPATFNAMDPAILKTLHIAAAFGLFASLGSTLLAGSRQKAASILHGVSLVLILLVGFAMLKKPPMDQHWWMVKIGLWLLLGIAPLFAKRKILPAPAVLVISIAAAAASAWLGLAKPF